MTAAGREPGHHASHGREYDMLGSLVELFCEDPRLGQAIDQLLAPFRISEEVPQAPRLRVSITLEGDRYQLWRDGLLRAQGLKPPELLAQLMADLNRTVLENYAGGLAVHAGVVHVAGRVITLPGESGSGKSTLTAACVRLGFSYLSDEALCLDLTTERVVPYPRPLALSTESLSLLGVELSPSPIEAGSLLLLPDSSMTPMSRQADLRLSQVVLSSRRRGPPQLEEAPRSEAVAALLHFSFNHYKRPQASFRLVTSLAGQCRAWKLSYEHPLDGARLLWDAFGNGDSPPGVTT